ncbi:MAG: hypothetical protein HZC14_02995 [Candidatus Niyogibacteria bacterium]|nr:hypothetical protein [Candidatus Niyogibacteria bacterium]
MEELMVALRELLDGGLNLLQGRMTKIQKERIRKFLADARELLEKISVRAAESQNFDVAQKKILNN